MKRRVLLLLLALLLGPASAGYIDIGEADGFLGSRVEIVWNTDDEKWVITFTEKEMKGMSTLFLSVEEMKRFRVHYYAAKKKTLALKRGQKRSTLESFSQQTHLHPTKVLFHGRAESEELKWLDIQTSSVHFTIPVKYENDKIIRAFEAALNKTQVVPRG